MGMRTPLRNFESGPQRKATTPVTSSTWGSGSFGPTIGFVPPTVARALMVSNDKNRNHEW